MFSKTVYIFRLKFEKFIADEYDRCKILFMIADTQNNTVQILGRCRIPSVSAWDGSELILIS